MTTEPNTWLISHSNLYSAAQIIYGKSELNAYTLFDLCNLSEAILFANKITTLPAESFLTREVNAKKIMLKITKELESNEIFEQIDVTKLIKDTIIQNIMYELKGGHEITNDKVIDDLAVILNHIFKIKTTAAHQIISNISRWGDSHYKSSIMNAFTPSSLLYNMTTGGHYISDIKLSSRYSHYKPSLDTEMMSVTYLRALLYFRIAGYLKLNYLPDSIRAPIVAYLNKMSLKKIDKKINELIQTADSNLKKQLNTIDTNHFSRDSFSNKYDCQELFRT